MKFKDPNILAKGISTYKIIINFLRIILGLLIIKFGFNISLGIETIKNISDNNFIILYIFSYIRSSSLLYTVLLALTLISFSIIEIIFVVVLINRKRWGAIGLFVTGFLWIPVEILFITQFLVVSKISAFIIDLLILYLLYRLLFKCNQYFKK